MAEFKDIQGQLQQAKKDREQSRKALFLSKEKLNKLAREKERLLRTNDAQSKVMQVIAREENALKEHINRAEGTWNEKVKAEIGLLGSFNPFTDPRKNIQQFSDDYPILLFPVRLETRYKMVTNREGAIQPQLWVRVFPDECSIDTFDDTLTEAEVRKAQIYWSGIWSAGKSDDENLTTYIQDRIKTSWRTLAGSLQSGRSYWITKNYVPANIDELPERATEEEIILTIATETLPSLDEQTALKDYWTAIWLANDSVNAVEAANAQLTAAVGSEDRGSFLKIAYAPINLKDTKVPEQNPPAVIVSFLQFPTLKDVETKLSSWSHAAKVTTLPERFVLLGYEGTNTDGNPREVLNAIGATIPDPLIIGPDPSLEIEEVLMEAMKDAFTALPQTDWDAKLETIYQDLKPSFKANTTLQEFVDTTKADLVVDIDAAVAKIFEACNDDVKAAQYIDYLTKQSETQWLFDFEEAVRLGLGFKVDLTPVQLRAGFDRLFVLGVKLSADELEAKAELEDLIQHHHFGTSGFSILPQGTPTNNTEEEDSGYTENEDFEETYERYFLNENVDDPNDFFTKKDGKWLGELLGIDINRASLNLVENYYQTDQCESKAMNIALWNATIGYFMESLMTPAFSDWDETVARKFFTEFVSGRGNLPAIRIGDQPYGILVTSAIKQAKWLDERAHFPFRGYSDHLPIFRKMFQLVKEVCEDWTPFLDDVAFVGKEGDAHQLLLKALGLHASSVEFRQRYAESFSDLFNRLNLKGLGGLILRILIEGGYKKRGLDLLKDLGYTPEADDEMVPILEKFFLSKSNLLKGDLIDDQPLSEINPIRAYTEPEAPETLGKNYIHWLIENALSDHNKIKRQQGFADGVPKALLYQMLRHSISLNFSNTAFKLYLNAQILDQAQIKSAKIDPDYIGVRTETSGFQSKYDYLDAKESRITQQDVTIGKHISDLLIQNPNGENTKHLAEIITALQHLKDVPTAALERAFAEHLDLCTYRLDAWLLAFVNLQLEAMRYKSIQRQTEDDEGTQFREHHRQGIYIGAYGWVENLKPDPETLSPVRLNEELKAIFNPDDNLEIVRDSNNAGFIHAPSINQAITASVLRNAYISNATQEDPEVYKVNLSSERVRMALGIIEGMQKGQSLGALLGYQLERGLHDRYEEAEVDRFIYELRIGFPLRANQMEETEENEGDINSITQIEARNVVDGLKLVNHVKETNNKVYPFGKNLLRGTGPQEAIINSEVDRILNINDAVADLAISESIHQVVQANYDRAAGTLDTYSKGSYPQMPDVIRTPRSGISLTNRVGIHLVAGLTAPAGANPRYIAEPAINDFLEKRLPAMGNIYCKVTYRLPDYEAEINANPLQELVITMADLNLTPIDLLYILDVDSSKGLSSLDEYLLKHFHDTISPRFDIEFEIKYTEVVNANQFNIFELAPLVRSLRAVILGARPLQATDMALSNEATRGDNTNAAIDFSRVAAAFTKFKTNFTASDPAQGLDLVAAAHPIVLLFDENKLDEIAADPLKVQTAFDEVDAYLDLFVSRLYSFKPIWNSRGRFWFCL